MANNTQEHLAEMPLQQISLPPPTTQIQILESSRTVRKITADVIITDSYTGGLLALND